MPVFNEDAERLYEQIIKFYKIGYNKTEEVEVDMEEKLKKERPKLLSDYNLKQGQRVLCTLTNRDNKVKKVEDSMIYLENGVVYLLQNCLEGAYPRKKAIVDICNKYDIDFKYSWSLGYLDSFLDKSVTDLQLTDFIYEQVVFKQNSEYVNKTTEEKIYVQQYLENPEIIFFKNDEGIICKMDSATNLNISFFNPKNHKASKIDPYKEKIFEMMIFKGRKSKVAKKALADLQARVRDRWAAVGAEVNPPQVQARGRMHPQPTQDNAIGWAGQPVDAGLWERIIGEVQVVVNDAPAPVRGNIVPVFEEEDDLIDFFDEDDEEL